MVSCSQPMNAVSTPTSGHTPFPGGGSGGPWSADPAPHQEAAAQLRPQAAGGTPLRGHHPPLLNHGPGHSLPPPDFLPPGSILRPMGGPPLRGAPFFIREIYKNGFLKRLPYNEKKSSALAKLMKTDRFWVVFSIHDDIHPFLELWHEPTEVANRPPQHIFPLAACQHISTSIVPAGDSEWSFVINFDSAVAIRFSCNSREVMDDWVEVIRAKLAEMGILNPKGNLYSRTPLGPPVTKPVIRDPTSPLPQPPPPPLPLQQQPSAAGEPSAGAAAFAAAASADAPETLTVMLPRKQVDETLPNSLNHQVATLTGTTTTTTTTRTKAVIGTVAGNPSSSFTTSIYLNRSSSRDATAANSAADHLVVGRKTSLPPPPSSLTNPAATAAGAHKTKMSAAAAKSLSSLSQSSLVDVKIASSSAPLDFSKGGEGSGGGGGATSSVYLNQSSPTRHVTVIPVNSGEGAATGGDEEEQQQQQLKETNGWTDEPSLDHAAASSSGGAHLESVENHTYGAIFHFDEGVVSSSNSGKMSSGGRGRDKGKKGSGGTVAELKSPSRRQQQQQAAPTATEKTSPSRRGRERTSRTSAVNTGAADNDPPPPPLPERPVALFRRLSERRHEAGPQTEGSRPHPLSAASNNAHSSNNNNNNSNNHSKGNKIRRKSRRSSSLGPFLDRASSQPMGGEGGGVGASTLSLESVDSNPRQAVPRAEGRYLGAVPRRPLLHAAAYSRPLDAAGPPEPGVAAAGPAGHHLLSSPSRALNDLGGVPGLRPPFYHHPLGAAHSGAAPSPATAAGAAFPPMVPLPGLTCQLSIPPGGFRRNLAAFYIRCFVWIQNGTEN
jgi:hypothetical protein